MALYLISYDLKAPRRDYAAVYDLMAQWEAQRLLESLWLANLSSSAGSIRDMLKATLDQNDAVTVIEVKPNSGWATLRARQAGVALLKQVSP